MKRHTPKSSTNHNGNTHHNYRGGRCPCTETHFLTNDWIDTPCPFPIKDLHTYRIEQQQVMLPIFCVCGKEVGELCFAGDQQLGKWRVHLPLPESETSSRLQGWLSQSYHREMGEVLDSLS